MCYVGADVIMFLFVVSQQTAATVKTNFEEQLWVRLPATPPRPSPTENSEKQFANDLRKKEELNQVKKTCKWPPNLASPPKNPLSASANSHSVVQQPSRAQAQRRTARQTVCHRSSTADSHTLLSSGTVEDHLSVAGSHLHHSLSRMCSNLVH